MQSISADALSIGLTQSSRPVLIDVRRQAARQASGQTIEGAIWRDPALWLDWKDEIAALPHSLVFFCVHGHEISQAMAAALRAMKRDAKYLEGGFANWQAAALSAVAIEDGVRAKSG
jgi:rhodanese-related sulfurtransferase